MCSVTIVTTTSIGVLFMAVYDTGTRTHFSHRAPIFQYGCLNSDSNHNTNVNLNANSNANPTQPTKLITLTVTVKGQKLASIQPSAQHFP